VAFKENHEDELYQYNPKISIQCSNGLKSSIILWGNHGIDNSAAKRHNVSPFCRSGQGHD